MTDNELNVMVATMVMGYKSRSNEAGTVYVSPNGNGLLAARDLPDYANDIATAFQVVEKLITLPHWNGLSLEHVTYDWRLDNGDGWICAQADSYQRDQGSGEIVAVAHTLPRAICLAALKAVESEDGENDEGIQGCLEDGTLGIRQDVYGNLYFGDK